MVLLDVNVLVTAMREDAPRHREINSYVEELRRRPEPFGLSDLVPTDQRARAMSDHVKIPH